MFEFLGSVLLLASACIPSRGVSCGEISFVPDVAVVEQAKVIVNPTIAPDVARTPADVFASWRR